MHKSQILVHTKYALNQNHIKNVPANNCRPKVVALHECCNDFLLGGQIAYSILLPPLSVMVLFHVKCKVCVVCLVFI